MSARPSVRPSTKCFFDFNEIWHVSRGWWAMHDGMQYDLIQGQGREPFKVGNPSIFKSYLLRHLQWELATDHWILNLDTTSKFNWVGFSIFVLVCVTRLWTWQKRQLRRVDRQSHTGKFVFFCSLHKDQLENLHWGLHWVFFIFVHETLIHDFDLWTWSSG